LPNPSTLIHDCLTGQSGACATLFDQHKALVYRTAYLMLGDARDAEDALQDVFLRAFRALDTYDPERGAFTTWLHKITVNVCLDRSRRRSPQEDAVPIDLDDPALASDPADDPFARLSIIEQAESLLAALDEDQRAVVVLRYYWNLAYQEIADIVGVPLGTVQSRLGRAIRKMRVVMHAMAQEVQQ